MNMMQVLSTVSIKIIIALAAAVLFICLKKMSENELGKDLLWLEKTRTAYLTYAKADCLKKYDIEIIGDHYTIEEKVKIITNYLDFAGTAREKGSAVPGTRLFH